MSEQRSAARADSGGGGNRPSGRLDLQGLALGAVAYTIWGLFPGYWPLLDPAGPVEVLGHRILWTAVMMSIVLTVTRSWRHLRGLTIRGWGALAVAALVIAVNWGTFIYAVSVGQVVEASLGYYMTPLVSVLLAVVVLRERLNAVRWVALAVALAAVLVIGIGNGTVPWLSLVLAFSFGFYALMKNRIDLPAKASVTAEGLLLAPVAIGYILWLQFTGSGTFIGLGGWHLLLMLSAGPVTALPLLLYGASARRLPLSVFGVLQYLNPTLQFLWGVLVVGEAMSTSRWIGFVLVWIALTLFSTDLLRQARRERAEADAASTSESREPVRSNV